jgi:hypothetical protein
MSKPYFLRFCNLDLGHLDLVRLRGVNESSVVFEDGAQGAPVCLDKVTLTALVNACEM